MNKINNNVRIRLSFFTICILLIRAIFAIPTVRATVTDFSTRNLTLSLILISIVELIINTLCIGLILVFMMSTQSAIPRLNVDIWLHFTECRLGYLEFVVFIWGLFTFFRIFSHLNADVLSVESLPISWGIMLTIFRTPMTILAILE
jgi:hypothetical protein